MKISKLVISISILLSSTSFANDNTNQSGWGNIDSYGEKAVSAAGAILKTSEDTISKIFESSKNEINKLIASPEIDIHDKINEIRGRVDEVISIKKKERNADSFTFFSKSKKDYKVDLDEILSELEEVLFDGEVVNYSSKIREARTNIAINKRDIAQLIEKKTFANDENTSIFQESKSDIENEINAKKQTITLLENNIENLENELSQKLNKLGVQLHPNQIRQLTTRIDGDEVSKTFATFDITKQISSKLRQLVKNNSYDSSFSVKYYGVYVILSEILGHAQRSHKNRINDIYLPALGKVKADISEGIQYARENLEKVNEANKIILQKNIDSNKLAKKVAEKYEELLKQQIKDLEKTIKKTDEQITVAYSTYDTVANSANLVMLIDQSQAEFDRLVAMQLPEMLTFKSIELENKFSELSLKLAKIISK